MKSFTIRAFALTLAIASAAATSVSTAAHAKTPAPSKIAITMNNLGWPAPMCLPSSGNYCGLD